MRQEPGLNRMQRNMEKTILMFYGIHMLSMIVVAFWSKWSTIVVSTMCVCFVLALVFTGTGFRSFKFRATISTALTYICMVAFAVNEKNFKDIIPMLIALSVLSGLYGIYGIGFIPTIATMAIYAYKFVVLGEVSPFGTREFMYECLHFINVLFVQAMIRFWNKKRNESQERMVEIISNIEAAEKSKDDFLANISHEIRTPVNTICGMSELALQDDNIELIKEKIWSIRTAGRTLTAIVSDVLDFSELQSEGIELQEEVYDITETLNDVINMAVAKRGDKHIDFVVDCDANLPRGLLGDEKKLRRVIFNLLDNAIKFTSDGGVSIFVEGRKQEYGINLAISIKDTGIGISDENMERIFTSFNQVDAKRNRKEGGIGLGLAISQSIVRKMGGAITFHSTLGKGSVFKVVVPQKVKDSTPIVTIKNSELLNIATFFNMENIDGIGIRDEYNNLIENMKKQLGLKVHSSMNLPELKRRISQEKFTHIFVGFPEYQLDPAYFDGLSVKTNVVIVLDHNQNKMLRCGTLLKLFKPFYLMSIVSILNGEENEAVVQTSIKSSSFTAPSAHVMVVDDNVMNIKVVEGLLAPYHIQVTSATNGAEAIALADSMDYDIIFMDHMMPGMDGVETMHHIREKGKEYFKNLCIIALTANAIAGTREMFMQEGFSDYIEKPVEPSVLKRALKRNLPDEKIIYDSVDVEEKAVPGKTEETKTDTPDNNKLGLNLGDIDVEKGLLYCGGIEKYKDILRMYAREADDQRRKLVELFENKSWKDYTIVVHAIKSSMFSIGAVTLSELAKKLEMAGKNNDISYINDNHIIMLKEFNRIMEILSKNFADIEEKEEQTQMAELIEVPEERILELAAEFENTAYILDKKRMLEIVDELETYKYNNKSIKEELEVVRHKVEMSDYISASDALNKVVVKGGL